MGWQGRMKQAKAERLFNKLPDYIRSAYKLIKIRCWRDNKLAHVFMKNESGKSFTVRINRETGLPVPFKGRDVIEPAYHNNVMGREL